MLRQVAAYYYDLLMAIGNSRAPHFVDVRRSLRYRLVADLSPFGITLGTCIDRPVLDLALGSPDSADLASPDEEESAAQEQPSKALRSVTSAPAMSAESATIYRIYRKQLQDPFNRETILAFPWVAGRFGSVSYCAPLLYVPVVLEVDLARRRATVAKHADSPHLNVVLLSRLVGDDGEWQVLQKQLVERLYSEQLSLDLVRDLLRVLSSGCKGLAGIGDDLANGMVSLSETIEAASHDHASLSSAAALINASRSHAFLLEDLMELRNRGDSNDESVIADILKETPDRVQVTEDPDVSESPLLFPFPSNRAQRRAARKAQRSRVLVVKGPPGTGKSQTIANLICHLVANGSTVLMTSHQDKALDVVLKMLPPLDYLSMSMLKGEKESRERLRSRLEGFEAQIANRSESALRSARDRAVHEMEENARRIHGLEARFAELKVVERDRAPVYRRYTEIKEFTQIDDKDTIQGGQERFVADALREWARLQEALLPCMSQLREIFGGSETSVEIRARRFELSQQAFSLLDQNDKEPRVAGGVELVHALRESGASIGDVVAKLRVLTGWWESASRLLQKQFNALARAGVKLTGLGRLRTVAQRRGHPACERVSASVAALISAHEKVQAIGAPPQGFPDPSDDRLFTKARYAAETLFRTRSWLQWTFFPEPRAARRELLSLGFPVMGFASLEVFAADFRRWSDSRSAGLEVAFALDAIAKLRFLGDSPHPEPTAPSFSQWLGQLVGQVEIVRLLSGAPIGTLPPRARSLVEGRLDASLSPEIAAQTARWLKQATETLLGLLKLSEIRRGMDNAAAWSRHFAPLDAVLMLRTDVVGSVQSARLLCSRYGEFERLLRLEFGELHTLPRTRQGVLVALSNPPARLDWLLRAEHAIEAHRLRRIIREELCDPDDIGAIARQIQELKKRNCDLVTKVLDAQIHLRLKAASDEPRVRNTVLKLRTLLRRRNRTNSFVSLRKQIDYRALLEVFPCWVLGIEDVSRVFPLDAGLFDYLIVDEASQCNQAATLQLAYRAKRLVIVGDEHQLRNANSRFLDIQAVEQLQRKHALVDHPKAVFLDGRKSLLDFAESCANQTEFLNEHFRCERPIIRWSNARFYNDRLRIMTPLRARRFSPTMEVRLVRGADEDREAKVNEVEARAIVAEIDRLVSKPEVEGLTIGVISPFREQANRIQQLLDEELAPRGDVLREHRVVSSTADGFQGDERDIVLYSFRHGPSSSPYSITAIEMEPERLNVAFTRARRLVVCFISRPVSEFPRGLIRDYLAHAQKEADDPEGGLGAGGSDGQGLGDRFDSDFERDVCIALRSRGVRVFTQVPCAGFWIDLVAMDREGRRIAIECDGPFHEDEGGGLRPEDYQRQDIIERSGWYVYRVSYRRWVWNPGAVIEGILAELIQQDPEEARVVAEAEVGEAVEEAVVDPGDPSSAGAPAEGATQYSGEGGETHRAPSAEARQPVTPISPAPPVGTQSSSTSFEHSLGTGPINDPRNWRALAKWGREANKLSRHQINFADSMVHILEHPPLGFTPRQVRAAQKLWNAAASMGFVPPFAA